MYVCPYSTPLRYFKRPRRKVGHIHITAEHQPRRAQRPEGPEHAMCQRRGSTEDHRARTELSFILNYKLTLL